MGVVSPPGSLSFQKGSSAIIKCCANGTLWVVCQWFCCVPWSQTFSKQFFKPQPQGQLGEASCFTAAGCVIPTSSSVVTQSHAHGMQPRTATQSCALCVLRGCVWWHRSAHCSTGLCHIARPKSCPQDVTFQNGAPPRVSSSSLINWSNTESISLLCNFLASQWVP